MTEKEKGESQEAVEDLLWRFGNAEFDERSWVLRVENVEIELEPRPLEILAYLLRHAGEVVTKDELLDAVWGRNVDTISDKVLTNAVGKLRRALKDEQESMLATIHRRGYRFVAPVHRVVLARRVVPKLDLKPGDAVPKREQWRLVRALDISARSEVWLAEHSKTPEQRVFKFSPDGARLSSLKREVTLSRVLRESLGERPEFIKVLEWNFEEAPYFIECEYGGDDWTQWAEAQGGLSSVSLDVRLALFVQAADAIGSAHGVGVLHKDLKPANLLIAQQVDRGWQVRLTDFGSGRLLEQGRLSELGITRLGFTQTQAVSSDSLTGTPLYLAPELLAGQVPTQASDVYALGVLLYQLVVSDFRKPLSAGWEREVDDELLREDIALAAAGDPTLRLDSARALAQRVARLPQRRRERMEAKHRQDELETASVALQKARQRRPWMAAAVFALSVGMLGTAWSYRDAVKAREQAEQSAEISSAINAFLTQDLVSLADPLIGGSKNLPLVDALSASEAMIAARFGNQPETEAALRDTLGKAFFELSRWADAERQWRLSLQRRQSAGLLTPKVESLLLLQRSLAATRESRMDDSLGFLTQAEALLTREGQAETQLLLRRDIAWGQYHFFNARFDQAAMRLAAATDILKQDSAQLPPVDRYKLAQSLSIAYSRLGRHGEAQAVLAELDEGLAKSVSPQHPLALYARYSRLTGQLMAGDAKGAATGLESLVSEMNEVLGSTHENALNAQHRLAQAQFEQGLWQPALQNSSAAYAGFRSRAGQNAVATLDTLNTRAEALKRLGRAAEAEPLLDDGAEAATRLYGAAHPLSLVLKANQVDALLDLKATAKAAALLQSLEPQAATLSAISPDWDGQRALHRGRLLIQGGQQGQGCAQLSQAATLLKAAHPGGHWLRDKAEQLVAACR